MVDTYRHKKANEKWQKIAESFGYKSEKDLYIHEFKNKDAIKLAAKIGVSAQTVRYRVVKSGISLYTGEEIVICKLCNVRPCTPPNKKLCDHCMQIDIEPGFEEFG